MSCSTARAWASRGFTEQVNFRRVGSRAELSAGRSPRLAQGRQRARVHLALGKHSVFKDQDEAPSASVALHLHPGQTLAADQVRGVRQLVAASVEGLKPDAVAIVDNHGNLLDDAEPGSADRKAAIEHGVAGRVREMLERVVGAGKVSVVATADVDERKTMPRPRTSSIKDRAAVRSEARTVDGPDATTSVGGIAGTRGNLPGTPAATSSTGSGAPGRLQETRTYEISHTVRQIENAPVQLVRLHVAVLVDDKLGPDGKPVVRSDKELGELVALARQAAGIDDARGDKLELHAIAFAADADQGPADVAPAAAPLGPGPPSVPVAMPPAPEANAARRRRDRGARSPRPQAPPRPHRSRHAGALVFPTPVAPRELEKASSTRGPPGRCPPARPTRRARCGPRCPPAGRPATVSSTSSPPTSIAPPPC